MSRRSPHIRTVYCAERANGCGEFARYEYDTRRDYIDAAKQEAKRGPWRCMKHADPSEWLSLSNLSRTVVLTSRKLPNTGDHLFWCEGDQRTGSGFTYGPGFRAKTAEFPEGTQLRVTVEVILP